MCPSRPTKGFTLAEVLFFVAILAVGVLGLFSTQTYALKCSQFNRMRHTSSTILSSELCEAEWHLSRAFNTDPSHRRRPVEGQPGFEAALVCVYHPDPGVSSNLRRVEARVYWTDPGASSETSASTWTYVYRVH